jgi:hypothetical protein
MRGIHVLSRHVLERHLFLHLFELQSFRCLPAAAHKHNDDTSDNHQEDDRPNGAGHNCPDVLSTEESKSVRASCRLGVLTTDW